MKIDYSQTYVYKLHTLSSTLDKAFDEVLIKNADISFSQFSLLLSINQFGTASQQSIAGFLHVSPAAVSRQVEVAQRNGHVKVKAFKDNRRQNSISLSPRGHDVIQEGYDALQKHLFKIFDDDDKSLSLMQHIDLLFRNTKGVIDEQDRKTKTINPKKNQINRKEKNMSNQIPKARKLFRGDINDAVIRVQKATGVHINDGWWFSKVGNQGSTEQILDRFDKHYPDFVKQQSKK